ncbi:glycosyltransferase [Ornithinimicrobium sufpigmenti]|uniref:glycosyltransferase n=1 Tax=Ornithinimicrobium sufpigmenti TaxID=2508882 RepID=UPI0015E19353|nr:glycosyltransferase [Ornithinimicrobium sp. HY008]
MAICALAALVLVTGAIATGEWLWAAGAAGLAGVAVVLGALLGLRLVTWQRTRINGLSTRISNAHRRAEDARAETERVRMGMAELVARVEGLDDVRQQVAALETRVSTVDVGLLQALGERVQEVDARQAQLDARASEQDLRVDGALQELTRIGEKLDGVETGVLSALSSQLAKVEEVQTGLEAAVQKVRQEARVTQESGSAEAIDSLRKRTQILTSRSRRSLPVLAGSATAMGSDLTQVLSAPDAQLVLEDSLARDEAVSAIPVIEAFDLLPRQSLTTLRHLYRSFRASGHWDMASKTVDIIASKSGKSGDKTTAQRVRQELAVFSSAPPTLPAAASSARQQDGPVLHVVGNVLPFTQTGYTLRTQYTVRAQMRRGIAAVVVGQSGSGDGDEMQRYTHQGVDYTVLAGPSRKHSGLRTWMRSNMEQLGQLVQELRPSIIHAHSDFLNVYAAHAVGSAYDIPVVYEVRGFWEESWLSRTAGRVGGRGWRWDRGEDLPAAYSLRKRAEERARLLPAHVFTLSSVMKGRIVEAAAGKLADEKVSLVPNAVTSADFPRQERDRRLAEDLGIPDDALVVGYISSLVEYEGIDTLIDAFKLVQAKTRTELRLLLVGSGNHAQDLREHANAHGVEGVIFTGGVPHEEVLRYYGLIDVFVVPRRKSTVTELVTPLKPFEAFSTGRAVVLSDVRALREIAQESGAAELFEPGDAASLAEVLTTLIRNPGRREELARKGAEWVRTHRSWERNASIYLETYRRLGYTGVP